MVYSRVLFAWGELLMLFHISRSLSPLRQVRSSVPQSPFHSESAANTTAKTESDDAAYQHTSYSKQGTAADRPGKFLTVPKGTVCPPITVMFFFPDDDMVSSGELSPNDAGLMSAPKTAQYSIYEGQGLGEQPNQEAPHRHIVVWVTLFRCYCCVVIEVILLFLSCFVL